jgi:hypothetical protein
MISPSLNPNKEQQGFGCWELIKYCASKHVEIRAVSNMQCYPALADN